MKSLRKFLVIDHNEDTRFLLTKTLLRKFPAAAIRECQDAATSLAVVAGEKLDAIVVHRG